MTPTFVKVTDTSHGDIWLNMSSVAYVRGCSESGDRGTSCTGIWFIHRKSTKPDSVPDLLVSQSFGEFVKKVFTPTLVLLGKKGEA